MPNNGDIGMVWRIRGAWVRVDGIGCCGGESGGGLRGGGGFLEESVGG